MFSEPSCLVSQESILNKELGSYCERMSEILRWQIPWRSPDRAETVGGGCGMSAVSSASSCIVGASGAKPGGCQMLGGTAGALTEATSISASECKQCLVKYVTFFVQESGGRLPEAAVRSSPLEPAAGSAEEGGGEASDDEACRGPSGVGCYIRGAGGEVWGQVVADEAWAWRLDSGRIAKKKTEGDRWTWCAGPPRAPPRVDESLLEPYATWALPGPDGGAEAAVDGCLDDAGPACGRDQRLLSSAPAGDVERAVRALLGVGALGPACPSGGAAPQTTGLGEWLACARLPVWHALALAQAGDAASDADGWELFWAVVDQRVHAQQSLGYAGEDAAFEEMDGEATDVRRADALPWTLEAAFGENEESPRWARFLAALCAASPPTRRGCGGCGWVSLTDPEMPVGQSLSTEVPERFALLAGAAPPQPGDCPAGPLRRALADSLQRALERAAAGGGGGPLGGHDDEAVEEALAFLAGTGAEAENEGAAAVAAVLALLSDAAAAPAADAAAAPACAPAAGGGEAWAAALLRAALCRALKRRAAAAERFGDAAALKAAEDAAEDAARSHAEAQRAGGGPEGLNLHCTINAEWNALLKDTKRYFGPLTEEVKTPQFKDRVENISSSKDWQTAMPLLIWGTTIGLLRAPTKSSQWQNPTWRDLCADFALDDLLADDRIERDLRAQLRVSVGMAGATWIHDVIFTGAGILFQARPLISFYKYTTTQPSAMVKMLRARFTLLPGTSYTDSRCRNGSGKPAQTAGGQPASVSDGIYVTTSPPSRLRFTDVLRFLSDEMPGAARRRGAADRLTHVCYNCHRTAHRIWHAASSQQHGHAWCHICFGEWSNQITLWAALLNELLPLELHRAAHAIRGDRTTRFQIPLTSDSYEVGLLGAAGTAAAVGALERDPSGPRRGTATGQPMFEFRYMPTMAWGHMQTWGWLCESCQMHARDLRTSVEKDGWPDPGQFDSAGNLWARTIGTCTDRVTGHHVTRLKWDQLEPEWKAAPVDWVERGLPGPWIPMCRGQEVVFPPDWDHVPALYLTTYQESTALPPLGATGKRPARYSALAAQVPLRAPLALVPTAHLALFPAGQSFGRRAVQEHVARLARASQVEMRASLGPDYDGKTKTRRDLNAKRTCALDACLELVTPAWRRWFIQDYKLEGWIEKSEATDYYVVSWNTEWQLTAGCGEDGVRAVLLSPNTDEIACLRVVFPRFPGRATPDDERGLHPHCRVYPTNVFLVNHDKVDGPLHCTSAVAPLPEKTGAAHYCADIAPGAIQHEKVKTALTNMYHSNVHRDDLCSWRLDQPSAPKVILGITDEADQVNEVLQVHPDVLGFSRFACYDRKIESGLVAPLQDRPIVSGLPWVMRRPLDNERLETVAKKLGHDVDEFRGEICYLHTEGMTPGDVHRVLMSDNPYVDITSNAKSGYANIHEAATCLEVVRALGPTMRNSGLTVKVIAPYAVQRTVLYGGWPQGKSGFWKNAALAESKQGNKKKARHYSGIRAKSTGPKGCLQKRASKDCRGSPAGMDKQLPTAEALEAIARRAQELARLAREKAAAAAAEDFGLAARLKREDQ
ncbi:unnamed protein product [Prorocentrum cordatum]|uniref:Uncharacterized protein n=1 Tax=Prorocentrum cordatum TaxID=2364126 RepID=A0ABN9SUY6_9DINO|nr:unnamed protein product [Polarella glacialis]